MENKKVLLKITDLKQYFPVGKSKSVFVKANDGITLDIYEGETLGLVGESGCGKSTLGRTLLQLYRQTDGKTMYYGDSIDDLAPKYVKDSISHIEQHRNELRKLEEKRDKLQAEYDAADEKTKFHLHGELTAAKKKANDAYLNIVNIIGGFIVADDLSDVEKIFTERYRACQKLKQHLEEMKPVKLNYDEEAYIFAKYESGQRGYDRHAAKTARLKKKVDACQKCVDDDRARIKEIDERIDRMRAAYANNPEFHKHEANRDEGIDLARLSYPEMRLLRSQMQYIFQDPYSSLNPRMTVASIIGEGLLAHKYYKKINERMQEEILKVMDECGLAPYFLHRYPHQFSGGQRQRIGIARSLAVRPKFVVCDEAVSALDVSIQSQIINLLQDLKEHQNLTYLFITHDLSVVKYISDRIGVMYLGNMVELADSEELFAYQLHPYTEALLESIPTTEEKKELIVLEGDIPSPVNPPKGCKFHTRCKYCTEICSHVVPEWRELRPNHFVACHHADEMLTREESKKTE